MKRLICIVSLFTLLIPYALADTDLLYGDTYVNDSSDLFNYRSAPAMSGVAVEQLNINDFNGSLTYQRELANIPGPKGLNLKLTLKYNQAVSHTVPQYYKIGGPTVTNINSPEWILGVNGLAFHVFNYESKARSEWVNSTDTLENSELAMLVSGYHVSNKMRGADPTTGRDIMRVLLDDGSTLSLQNMTRADDYNGDHFYGRYTPMGKNMDVSKAWVTATQQFAEAVGTRKLYLYRGDGTRAIYSERFADFSDDSLAFLQDWDYTHWKPHYLQLDRIENAFGDFIEFTYKDSVYEFGGTGGLIPTWGHSMIDSIKASWIIDGYIPTQQGVSFQYDYDNYGVSNFELSVLDRDIRIDTYSDDPGSIKYVSSIYQPTTITTTGTPPASEEIHKYKTLFDYQHGTYLTRTFFHVTQSGDYLNIEYNPSRLTTVNYYTGRSEHFEYLLNSPLQLDVYQNCGVGNLPCSKSDEYELSGKRDPFFIEMVERSVELDRSNDTVLTKDYDYWSIANDSDGYYDEDDDLYSSVLIKDKRGPSPDLLNTSLYKNIYYTNIFPTTIASLDQSYTLKKMKEWAQEGGVQGDTLYKNSYEYDLDADNTSGEDLSATYLPSNITHTKYNNSNSYSWEESFSYELEIDDVNYGEFQNFLTKSHTTPFSTKWMNYKASVIPNATNYDTLVYAANLNDTMEVRANGNDISRTEYQYNAKNQIIQIDAFPDPPNSPSISNTTKYSYYTAPRHGVGNLWQVEDPKDNITEYRYNPWEENDELPFLLAWYDGTIGENDNPFSKDMEEYKFKRYPSQINKYFTKNGYLDSITTYQNFDKYGNRDLEIDANWYAHFYEYDDFNRLTKITRPGDHGSEKELGVEYTTIPVSKEIKTEEINNYGGFSSDTVSAPSYQRAYYYIYGKCRDKTGNENGAPEGSAQVRVNGTIIDEVTTGEAWLNPWGYKIAAGHIFIEKGDLLKVEVGIPDTISNAWQVSFWASFSYTEDVTYQTIYTADPYTTSYEYDDDLSGVDEVIQVEKIQRVSNKDLPNMVIGDSLPEIKTVHRFDERFNLIGVRKYSASDVYDSTIITYDHLSRELSSKDYRGFETTLSYDGLSRIDTITNPGSSTSINSFSYGSSIPGNPDGWPEIDYLEITTSIDEEGNKSATYSDALGQVRLIETYTTGGSVYGRTYFDYDALGNVIKSMNPEGQVSLFQYNGLSQLMMSYSVDTDTTNYRYDGNGNLTFEQSAVRREDNQYGWIYHKYNEFDQLIESGLAATTPYSEPSYSGNDLKKQEYIYGDPGSGNSVGCLSSAIDYDAAHIDVYEYDYLGRVSHHQSLFDVDLDKTVSKNSEGTLNTTVEIAQTIQYSLSKSKPITTYPESVASIGYTDLNDQFHGIDYIIGSDLVASKSGEYYIPAGAVVRLAVDIDGGDPLTYTAQFTHLKPSSGNSSKNYSSNYTYNSIGKVDTLLEANGDTLTFYYNSLGLLDSTSTFIDSLFYNENDMITDIHYANGVNDIRSYNNRNWIVGNSVYESNPNSPLWGRTYTYFDNGNLDSEYLISSSRVASYDYDELSRLTDIDYASYTDVNYDYDKIGNRTYEDAMHYLYSSTNNQLLGYGTDTTKYEYDKNGNLTGDFLKGLKFDYDWKDRLIHVRKDIWNTWEHSVAGVFQVEEISGDNELSYYASNNTNWKYATKEFPEIGISQGTGTTTIELDIVQNADVDMDYFWIDFGSTNRDSYFGYRIYERGGDHKAFTKSPSTGLVITLAESISYTAGSSHNLRFKVDHDADTVKFYFDDVLKSSSVIDNSMNPINQIYIQTTEAHFHVDDIRITSSSYNPTEFLDDFEDDDDGLIGDYIDYVYNTNDERIMQASPEEITAYIASSGNTQAEYDGTGNLKYNYIYAGGRKLARVDSAGIRVYYHSDYLGSTRVVTSSTGVVLQARDYRPFGAELYASGSSTDYKFCGKERDDEIDLDYSWYRYYDFNLGRFTQVDPLWYKFLGEGSYNYAENNPLVKVDPDGRSTVGAVFVADLLTPDPSDVFVVAKAAGYAVAFVVEAAIVATVASEVSTAIEQNTELSSENSSEGTEKTEKQKRREQIRKERKERKENEPASKKEVAREKKKQYDREGGGKKGREANRRSHDKKKSGEPDRSKKQIKQDYRE